MNRYLSIAIIRYVNIDECIGKNCIIGRKKHMKLPKIQLWISKFANVIGRTIVDLMMSAKAKFPMKKYV
jgi:hypothetical protein